MTEQTKTLASKFPDGLIMTPNAARRALSYVLTGKEPVP